MYDKVKMWVMGYGQDIGAYLDRAREQTDLLTGEVCTFGSLDGMKISIFPGGVSIIGSLAKYFYPNNIYPLDRHTTGQALEKLSDGLHLSVKDAKVTGLEFGAQFVMEHPVQNYLSRLGDMPRLLRYHFEPGTLYYKPRGKQQQKIFCFYDKRADAAVKDMILPVGLENANLLKYEMRLNGRLSKLLGVADIRASTLTERPFYRQLMESYQRNYYSISKESKEKTIIMNEIKTVSDAYDVFVARLISQSNQTEISSFVDELKEAKVFNDRKSYTRLKKKIIEVATKTGTAVPDELLKELDNEIKNVGAYS